MKAIEIADATLSRSGRYVDDDPEHKNPKTNN